jgi:hypothetical protein
MNVNLNDNEIQQATSLVRTHLENIVDSITNNADLKDDQLRIIWTGIADFANDANQLLKT